MPAAARVPPLAPARAVTGRGVRNEGRGSLVYEASPPRRTRRTGDVPGRGDQPRGPRICKSRRQHAGAAGG